MKLETLLNEIGVTAPPGGEVEVAGVRYDSRQVKPGDLFVAITGFATDGHDYLDGAAENGACLALVEREVSNPPLPVVRVADTRKALADLACAFYGHPTQALTLVGITGTNGKTTTAWQVESVLQAADHSTALFGTVETRLDGQPLPTNEGVTARTTPESPDLQALMAHMVRDGASAAVMEVSSHSLSLSRVRGCAFDVGVFTNLTPDHLDFHRTMEAYFEAKCLLFKNLPAGASVVNVDDPWGGKLANRLERPVTFGMRDNAVIYPRDLSITRTGIRFRVRANSGEINVASPMVGAHNVYNLLAAAGVGVALGIDPQVIGDGLSCAPPVPGRLEPVETEQPFSVLVDYAHTPDALERLLEAVRPMVTSKVPAHPPLSGKVSPPPDPNATHGRIITVFGCGGDRDTTKRAPMGKVAAKGSDQVFITADNPRSEDPAIICKAIEKGARSVGGVPVEVELDREEAIRKALAVARAGDVVLIAGKGHEAYQIVGDREVPFDDRKVARKMLQAMQAGAA